MPVDVEDVDLAGSQPLRHTLTSARVGRVGTAKTRTVQIDTGGGDDDAYTERVEMQAPNFITVDSVIVPVTKSRMSLSRNSSSERITYTWSNISVSVASDVKITGTKARFRRGKKIQSTKDILKNVSGTLYPGELVCVLGSSGAGKSTLMDVLAFRNSHKLRVTGERAINGVPVESNTITSISAYVQQQDLFIGVLTVREHLVFQAQVRMHEHISYQDRMDIVEEVIQEFGLSKCADTQIGTKWLKGISGGEAKRVSIATEVLTDPMFMCCDEPTSGLDSNTAQQVISVLKKLASKQKTVICTVHQPSSQLFALFDRVLLMAEGRVAFLGTASEALQFFSIHGYNCPPMFNPADFLIDILAIKAGYETESRDAIYRIAYAFAETQLTMNNTTEKTAENLELIACVKPKSQSPYKASAYKQFRAVLKRSWISFARDPMVFKMRLAQTVFLSLLIGTIFYQLKLKESEGIQNLNGAMFMILCSLTYQHMLAALDNFCSELPVFLREHFNGMYRTDVYFISKMIVEFPFYILMPLFFSSICYFMIGFEPTAKAFILTGLIMILVTIICAGIGCFLSCLAKDITVALLMAPPIIFPFFIFGGFLLRPGSGPVFLVWLENFSWYLYGYEAMAIVQMENLKGIECTFPTLICPSTGRQVLRGLNFDKDNLSGDILALILLAIGSQILAYLSLLARTVRK